MGRSIAFDLDKAVDNAMKAFWKNGYAATSLRDLLSATGLGEGSFYNTLKSKKRLYLECLRRYSSIELQSRMDALSAAPTTATGLRAMFRMELDGLDDPKRPSPMCMMVGMVTPEVLADNDLRNVVEGGQQRFEGSVAALIKRDIAAGILPSSMDAEVIASLVATFGQGLSRMALIRYHRASSERQIETFLSGLGF